MLHSHCMKKANCQQLLVLHDEATTNRWNYVHKLVNCLTITKFILSHMVRPSSRVE